MPEYLSVFFFYLIVLSRLSYVSANTEIVNFEVNNVQAAYIPESVDKWLHLTPESHQVKLSFTPPQDMANSVLYKPTPATERQPEELWIALDLDHERWAAYSRFTLRISWPAYYPTDFRIIIDSPAPFSSLSFAEEASPSRISPSTRIKFAHIILRHTGVRPDYPKDFSSNTTKETLESVPFVISLEPLHLGVIPASVTPILLFMIPLIGFASIAAGHAWKYLDTFAGQIVQDIHDTRDRNE